VNETQLIARARRRIRSCGAP